jgi:hypothetical protein
MKPKILSRLKANSPSEWLVLAALAVWSAGQTATWFLPVWDPITPTTASWLAHWVRDIGILAAAMTAIATNLWSIRRDGFSRRPIVVLLAALAVSIYFFALCVYGYRSFVYFGKVFVVDLAVNSRMDAIIQNTEKPIEKRVKLSQLHASRRFVEDGVLVNQLLSNGEYKQYAPSNQDLQDRAERLQGIQTVNWGVSAMKRASIRWAGCLVLGFGLGLLIPTGRDKKAATQQEHEPER